MLVLIKPSVNFRDRLNARASILARRADEIDPTADIGFDCTGFAQTNSSSEPSVRSLAMLGERVPGAQTGARGQLIVRSFSLVLFLFNVADA